MRVRTSLNEQNVSLAEAGDSTTCWQCVEEAGARLELQLKLTFRRWAMICIQHPVIVIFCSVAVIAAMSCGLLFFKVTTDPVLLWSCKFLLLGLILLQLGN